MQVPLEIATRGITLTDRQTEDIRVRAEKLEKTYDRITRCSIFVDGPGDHKRTGGPFKVRVEMAVPGTVLVVDRRRKEDLREAINAAFMAARRRLEEYARTRRGEVKAHEPQPCGWIVRLFEHEGYGFIETDDGREVYFHRNSVLAPGFDRIEVGDAVRFAEELGERGPRASTVALTG